MVRLGLLLMGGRFVRKRAPLIGGIGVALVLLGLALVVDSFDGVAYFPLHFVGYILCIEAMVTLVTTSDDGSTRTILRKGRGIFFLFVGILIIDRHRWDDIVLAIVFGLAFVVDGVWRIAAAWVVRFAGWRWSLAIGVVGIACAVLLFLPYPVPWEGTVPFCVGCGLLMSGLGTIRIAARLWRMPENALLASYMRGNVIIESKSQWGRELKPEGPLVVHVWTPVGSVSEAVAQPVVDRYIAAVDAKGVISTGHAALEAPPDIYVSHYPAVEIDRSSNDFISMLRATSDNDVPGRFQPSYAFESADWCESTEKIVFPDYNPYHLRSFWEHYRQDATYNLTSRNCSSTAASTLEAALQGTLGQRDRNWRAFGRALLCPELWVAGQIRRHADAMAWTPGLVLDYARALRVAIDPPPLGWTTLADVARSVVRYFRAVVKGTVIKNPRYPHRPATR